MDTKADRQVWFEHLCRCSGPDGQVLEHRDRDGANRIEIFSGNTADGMLHATLRLMEVNQGSDEKPAHTELLLDVESRDPKFGNALALAALTALRGKVRIGPGVMFDNALTPSFPELPLKHLMLVAPFQWKSGIMTEVPLVTGTLYPLCAVPVTDAERELALSQGPRALEQVWADRGVNVLDVSRTSAV